MCAKVLGNLIRSEEESFAGDRVVIGQIAQVFAGFIRRHRFLSDKDQKVGEAFAARAEEVARKCFTTSRPDRYV